MNCSKNNYCEKVVLRGKKKIGRKKRLCYNKYLWIDKKKIAWENNELFK